MPLTHFPNGIETSKVVITGDRVLTVGTNGQYTTLQAAIDYIETQDSFIATTNIEPLVDLGGGFYSGYSISDWAQDSETITYTRENTSAAEISYDKGLWLGVDSEDQLYKMRYMRYRYSVGTETIQVDGRRIGASISSATEAFTTYKENIWTIDLLDSEYNETITIDANVCVRFKGNGAKWSSKTDAVSAISRGTNFKYGVLEFVDIKLDNSRPSAFMSHEEGWDTANTIDLRFLEGTELRTVTPDLMSPSINIGTMLARGCSLQSNPTGGTTHFFFFVARGSCQVHRSNWEFIGVGEGVYRCGAYLFDATKASHIIVAGLNVQMTGPVDNLSEVGIVKGARFSENTYVSDVTVTCQQPLANATGDITLVDMEEIAASVDPSASSPSVHINNCHLSVPNYTDTVKYLYKGIAGTATTVNVDASSGGILENGGSDTITCRKLSWIQSVDYAATVTPDPNLGDTIDIGVLTGNITINNPTNPVNGQKMTLWFTKDNNTTLRAVSFDTDFKQTGTYASTVANAQCKAEFEYDGTYWYQTNVARWA